jgi:hypothetical protein
MKAVVFRGVGGIRPEGVPGPRIEQPTERFDPRWVKAALLSAQAPEW